MQRKRMEFMVGLFVLAGFISLLFVSMQAANLGSFSFNAKGYTVTANFDNIGGLKPRAPVKSAGVVVGRVKSIEFDGKAYQARVTLDLDASYKFPADSSVKILTSGLLGEQYVGIQAGGDDEDLKDGARIEQTQSAIVLENLISQFLFQMADKGNDKK